jgi:hypothetical protein
MLWGSRAGLWGSQSEHCGMGVFKDKSSTPDRQIAHRPESASLWFWTTCLDWHSWGCLGC